MQKLVKRGLLIALMAVTLIAFLPAISTSFVKADDQMVVNHNMATIQKTIFVKAFGDNAIYGSKVANGGKQIFVTEAMSLEDFDAALMDNAPATKVLQTQANNQVLIAMGTAYENRISYSWTRLKNAVEYKMYFAKCSKKCKCVATTDRTSFVKRNLKTGKAYKAYVVAYDKGGNKIAKSPLTHLVTKGKKYSNVTNFTAAKRNLTISWGDTFKLDTKIARKDGNKKLLNHCPQARFISSNPTVASVDENGVISALREGSAVIYSIAESGASYATNVKVKSEHIPVVLLDEQEGVAYGAYIPQAMANWDELSNAKMSIQMGSNGQQLVGIGDGAYKYIKPDMEAQYVSIEAAGSGMFEGNTLSMYGVYKVKYTQR